MSAVDTLFALSLFTRCKACKPERICAEHAQVDNLADPGEAFCADCGFSHGDECARQPAPFVPFERTEAKR